jgi:hypothetical protein
MVSAIDRKHCPLSIGTAVRLHRNPHQYCGERCQCGEKTADGEAYKLDVVGKASAVKTREQGLAVAAGLEAQQAAIGKDQAAIVSAVKALAEGAQRFMPENLALTVGGEGGLGTSLSALVPLLMRNLQDHAKPAAPAPAHPHSDGETAPVAVQAAPAAVQPAPLSRPPLSYKLG